MDDLAGASEQWPALAGRSLPELVRERVVEAIRTGALRPGERLVETTLARRLGVSRAPLREALKLLEAQQLVEARRGRGTFVARISAAQMAQMSVARAALEGMAARLVAAQADPAVLRGLSRLHRDLVRAAGTGDFERWRDLDLCFHEMVCEGSGNAFLLRGWQAIGNLIRLFLHENRVFEIDSRAVLGNHDRMIAALASGDPDRAEQVFRSLILQGARLHLGQDPEAAAPAAARPPYGAGPEPGSLPPPG